MTNVSIVDVKGEIRTVIDELISEGTLKQRLEQGFAADPAILENAGSYPVAIMRPVFIRQNTAFTNAENDRVYMVGFSVVFNADDDTVTPDTLDETVEKILDKFDDKITLNGAVGNGFVEPITTEPYRFKATHDYVAVDIVLAVHTIRQFGFGGQ